MIKRLFLFSLLTCLGCSSPTFWQADSMTGDSPSFSSSRLVYQDPTHQSHLQLEFLQIGGKLDLFLNLTQLPITTPVALAKIQLGDDPPFEEELPVLAGGMRLRFSEATAQRIAKTLQDGAKVGIFVDDFEEQMDPGGFSPLYQKLMMRRAPLFQNIILKGLLQ